MGAVMTVHYSKDTLRHRQFAEADRNLARRIETHAIRKAQIAASEARESARVAHLKTVRAQMIALQESEGLSWRAAGQLFGLTQGVSEYLSGHEPQHRGWHSRSDHYPALPPPLDYSWRPS
jgi:hypothetical protein